MYALLWLVLFNHNFCSLFWRIALGQRLFWSDCGYKQANFWSWAVCIDLHEGFPWAKWKHELEKWQFSWLILYIQILIRLKKGFVLFLFLFFFCCCCCCCCFSFFFFLIPCLVVFRINLFWCVYTSTIMHNTSGQSSGLYGHFIPKWNASAFAEECERLDNFLDPVNPDLVYENAIFSILDLVVVCISTFLLFSFFHLTKGAPADQWVKRWPSNLAVAGSSPAGGGVLSIVNGVPLHTAFHCHPDIVLIWLKYCWKGRKIASHPSIHPSIHPFHAILTTQ